MAELKNGVLVDTAVAQDIISVIERGAMDVKKIQAIVIHQTHGFNAAGAIKGWKEGRVIKTKKGTTRIYPGTHFVIDRGSGTVVENGKTYSYTGIDGKITQTARVNQKCSHVMKLKQKLYPTNSNSIGIELVGRWTEEAGYSDSSVAQINSATWLVMTLISLISNIPADGLYAHGVISREKKEDEGLKSLESIKKEIEKRKAEKEKAEKEKQISIHTTVPLRLPPMAIDNTRVRIAYVPDRFLTED